MAEDQALLQQLRRAGDFASISRRLLRELDAVAEQYVADATDKEFAVWDVTQWRGYLAAVEEKELGKMRSVCDQLGYVPEGWRVPGRTPSE